MKSQLANYLDNAITFLLLLVAGFTPLFFLNQTTEFFEMPKLIFLVLSTTVLLGLWIFSWIVKGKIQVTRTPLDIPLIALLVVVLLSTFFSGSRYASIYGNFPRVHGSAISWVTYILLYFITVSNLKSIAKIKTFLYVVYGSAGVVALVTLLSFFGVFLPLTFAQSVNFTPTGSSFSTIAFLLMLLPLPLLSTLRQNKYMPASLAVPLATLFALTIVLIGSLPTYIILAIVFVLSVVIAKPQLNKINQSMAMFIVPALVTVLALVLVYLPLPGNVIQQLEAKFPREIQLNLPISWKISASAFRDAPYLGTGPSTYLFNFTSYKPLEFNVLDYWNFSFDTAYNEFLQTLATLGILGLLSMVVICLIVLNNSRKNMVLSSNDATQDSTHVMVPAMAISGVISILLLAIHASTLISTVVTLFMFAVLMVSQKSVRDHVMNLSMGIKASTSDDKQFDLFPVIVFLIFVIAAVPLLIKSYNVIAADYYHRQALVQASRNGTLTYTYLQKAESLNPVIDLYRVDIAQTNFALANALAARKGPTKDNPNGSLTDQDKRTIQTLLSQAINEGRVSVALSPSSSRNWEVLASIYRNITGVAQNALAFSLDAYGRAIQRDPLNPLLRLSVGGIYYSAKNYDLAIRFFSDAANLKPDYANAYYNLAIALRDKGDLQNAKLVADQTVSLMQKNPQGPDYKIATDLVKDLTSKIASTAQKAPASQTGSALNSQNVSGVNVSGLNNPPEVATPAAIKQNPSANLPQAKPTTAPAKP